MFVFLFASSMGDTLFDLLLKSLYIVNFKAILFIHRACNAQKNRVRHPSENKIVPFLRLC